MNKQKGFTIIELIVVIAIIAVLAAIVLVNVTSYTNKGKDAAAKGNLASMLTNGLLWYAGDTNPVAPTPGTYRGWYLGGQTITAAATCDSVSSGSGFSAPCRALINAGYTSIVVTCDITGSSCNPGASKWCAMVNLKASTNTYCVDSSGNKLEKASGSGACALGVCS